MCQGFRGIPSKRAAKCPAATSEPYGDKRVIVGGEARAGKAQDHAALGEEGFKARREFLRQGADIGEDQYRDFFVEQCGDCVGNALAGFAQIGEGRERTGYIPCRRQKGLGDIDG